ncbi:putative Ig domain-containing protein [Fodinibius salsisoli]|uniref:putative Ig domain-containing protein n=1 Tax=Fodinibius salsisoli TaxID=2820877 RepID=UPI002246A904
MSDGSADTTQVFEITVTSGNQGPAFISEAVTSAQETKLYRYTVIASDPDGDGLAFSAETLPEWLALSVTSDTSATLKGTPGPEDSGEAPVELTVTDGSATASQSFTITVGNTNRAPSFDSEPVTQAQEGETYSYGIEASDPDGDSLSITAEQLPGWATITDHRDGTATLEGPPGPDDIGDVSVELEVSDGTDTVTQKFTITVARTNQEPAILSQPSLQVPSEIAYRYVVAAIDTAGSDGGGKLTFGAELENGAPLPGWLSWEDIPDEGPLRRKALVGTPPPSAMGTYQIVVSVTDGGTPSLTTEQQFTLRVTQGNRGPTIGSSPVEVVRIDQTYSYTIEASDPDADKVDFSASLSGGDPLPEWLSLQASSDTTATVTGEPAEEDMGTYQIRVRATDNGTPRKQTTQEFTLQVKYKQVDKLNALYNYPNPFRAATAIKFELPEEAEVTLQLYNLTGALVRQRPPEVFGPGANEFKIRARNLASGIYIYRITSGGQAVTGKITLIR